MRYTKLLAELGTVLGIAGGAWAVAPEGLELISGIGAGVLVLAIIMSINAHTGRLE